MSTPAVFLDRDGTIIRDAHYIRDPRQVELLVGVPTALRKFEAAKLATIVVTNQSGIARGFLKEADYFAVRDELDRQLAAEKIHLTATYHCPHHPEETGPCECRKPGRLLYRRAIEEHDLDITKSWGIGDRWRDIAPVIGLGGRGILVPTKETPDSDIAEAISAGTVVRDFTEAAAIVLASQRA
jgi:D-glycero-D-manno-heptose 1,7-bisphosphate phosphatase